MTPTGARSSVLRRQVQSWQRYPAVLLNLAARLLPTWRSRGARRRRLREIERACRALPAGETIFVSVASYRDPQCPETVFDLFEKAACPSRVFVGVCQQNDDSDADVLEAYRKLVARRGAGDFSAQIRVHRLDADRAQGPMAARHRIEGELYRDERYYLIIDSHTLFTPRWDVACIHMWTQARKLSPKPILTMYPAGFKPFRRRWPKRGYENRPPGYVRFLKFIKRTGLVHTVGFGMQRIPERPLPSLFWVACYSFGLGSQIREVPFDPHCPYVFIGEEISMAARLWTHGYDFFHPTRMVVYHMRQQGRPTFWRLFDGDSPLHEQRRELEQAGYRRIQTLLGIHEGRIEAPYGLGTARTLADYEGFIGIDMRRQVVTSLTGLTGVPANSPPEEVLCRYGSLTHPFSSDLIQPGSSP
ncbi:MAG: hypothetical protein LGR52_07740 [Candidatus Thiosymbion ectosymbiont of Robbea hypermnestra]|nr:hypothetical protein [Candidatus Thiosymbion ectosymbiont of Robbea hypermnestra]